MLFVNSGLKFVGAIKIWRIYEPPNTIIYNQKYEKIPFC